MSLKVDVGVRKKCLYSVTSRIFSQYARRHGLDVDHVREEDGKTSLQLSLSSSTPFHPSGFPLDLSEENSWETGKLWKSVSNKRMRSKIFFSAFKAPN
ncbi:hypothetical protein V1478_004021 [Vespula squamosa]|uniref:Uncharacterized protein n=1 Tax=Vespula squamosa TaxID=30214 RepID=A0ABD2BNG8_VESSQ